MVDWTSLEARLAHLRHQLDDYGVYGKDENRTCDQLIDHYYAALEGAAKVTGIDVPGPPRSIGRRFTGDARDWLEAAVTASRLRVC